MRPYHLSFNIVDINGNPYAKRSVVITLVDETTKLPTSRAVSTTNNVVGGLVFSGELDDNGRLVVQLYANQDLVERLNSGTFYRVSISGIKEVTYITMPQHDDEYEARIEQLAQSASASARIIYPTGSFSRQLNRIYKDTFVANALRRRTEAGKDFIYIAKGSDSAYLDAIPSGTEITILDTASRSYWTFLILSNPTTSVSGSVSFRKFEVSLITDNGHTFTDDDPVLVRFNFDVIEVDNSTIIKNSAGQLRVKDQGIGTTQLANNAVSSSKILNNAVNNTKIAINAIRNSHILNGTITKVKLAAGVVPDKAENTDVDIAVDGSADATANDTKFITPRKLYRGINRRIRDATTAQKGVVLRADDDDADAGTDDSKYTTVAKVVRITNRLIPSTSAIATALNALTGERKNIIQCIKGYTEYRCDCNCTERTYRECKNIL